MFRYYINGQTEINGENIEALIMSAQAAHKINCPETLKWGFQGEYYRHLHCQTCSTLIEFRGNFRDIAPYNHLSDERSLIQLLNDHGYLTAVKGSLTMITKGPGKDVFYLAGGSPASYIGCFDGHPYPDLGYQKLLEKGLTEHRKQCAGVPSFTLKDPNRRILKCSLCGVEMTFDGCFLGMDND